MMSHGVPHLAEISPFESPFNAFEHRERHLRRHAGASRHDLVRRQHLVSSSLSLLISTSKASNFLRLASTETFTGIEDWSKSESFGFAAGGLEIVGIFLDDDDEEIEVLRQRT